MQKLSPISGEITSTTPSLTRAGIVKHRVFPPPVGMSTKASRPERGTEPAAGPDGPDHYQQHLQEGIPATAALMAAS